MNAILRSTVLFAQKDFASPEVGAVHTNSNFSPSADGPAEFSELENYLQVSFSDQRLLRMALTHPSFANEHPEDSTEDNERLEFLGDAVLGMIVARSLYQRFPDVSEGNLTEWRAYLVCGPTLSRVAESLELGRFLRLGRGEEQTGGRQREGNLERAYEAVVGAVYLDGGLEAANHFVQTTLAEDFATLAASPEGLNPKGTLQELVQQNALSEADESGRPEYVLISETGPDHRRYFEVAVEIDGEELGRGSGSSKQQAEKEAAVEALTVLRAHLDGMGGHSCEATDREGQ